MLLPLNIYPSSSASGIFPVLFIITRCISTYWMFAFYGLSAMPNMESRLRDPLCYWRSSQFFDAPKILGGTARSWGSSQIFGCLWRFRRGLRSGQGLFAGFSLTENFHASCWYFTSTWSSCRSPILSKVALFLRSCMAVFFDLLFIPKCSLFYRGSKILGGTDLRLWAISLGFFSLNFCLVIQQQIRYLGTSTLISGGLASVAVFPLNSVEEKKIK